MSSAEHRTHTVIRILSRLAVNTALVFFFLRVLPDFFLLQGGIKAIILVSIILTVLNWIVVPILHILSLPIKLFAWIIGFFLVNMAALWLTVWFVMTLKVPGMSLAIGGGIIGWLALSLLLGVANWLVKAILK